MWKECQQKRSTEREKDAVLEWCRRHKQETRRGLPVTWWNQCRKMTGFLRSTRKTVSKSSGSLEYTKRTVLHPTGSEIRSCGSLIILRQVATSRCVPCGCVYEKSSRPRCCRKEPRRLYSPQTNGASQVPVPGRLTHAIGEALLIHCADEVWHGVDNTKKAEH